MSATVVTTPVELDSGAGVFDVPLPAGWSRVWSGPVHPGDRHLDCVQAGAGAVAWKPITFADLVEGDDVYDTAAWYSCVIRERDRPVGEPCRFCKCRPPLEGLDACLECEGE